MGFSAPENGHWDYMALANNSGVNEQKPPDQQSEASTKVVVSDSPFVDVETLEERLAELDATIEAVDTTDEATLRNRAEGAQALILDVNSPLTPSTLDALDTLEVVARAGMGLDNIAIDAAREAGVTVTHAPEYGIDEVATHAVSLLLACRRNIAGHDRDVRAGEWNWMTDRPQPQITGSTLGLVSFGATARRVVELTQGMDFDVVVFDPFVDAETIEEYGGRKVDFETLLAESDLVSIHAPLTEDTRGLFDQAAFEQMQSHAVVVNVGRGGIVDEEALAAALTAEEIAAAGLDVLATEPPTADNPLFDCENAVLTPHTAWYSEDAHERLNHAVATDVHRVLTGEQPEYGVDRNGNGE